MKVPVLAPNTEEGGGGTSEMDIIMGDESTEEDSSPAPAKIDEELKPVGTEEDEEEISDEETEDSVDEQEEESTDDTEESDEIETDYTPRPTVKTIEAKFPGLFKTFPGLKQAFFLEKQYREIFATPDDAREAADKAPLFKAFEQDIIAGNSKLLLESIKENGGSDSLNEFVDRFLPTLLKTDKDSYVRATKPILVGVLKRVEEVGTKNENKNLINAARLIHQAVFGSLEIQELEAPKENPEKKKIVEERDQLNKERFEEFHSIVMNDGEAALVAEIEKRADPNKVLSEGMRKYVIKECFSQLMDVLSADKQHMARINSLWRQAKESLNDRSTWSQSKSRLISAYLARARAEVPAITKKLLSEALGKNKPVQRKETKVIPSGGTVRQNKSKVVSVGDARKAKMTDMDIIMSGSK